MGKFIGATGLPYLWSKIKNLLATGLSAKADKATTLAGYGITDAVTLDTTQTITGNKKFSYSKLEIDGGEYKFNFHIERRFSGLTNNGNYSTWDSEKKDGTWHRIWRVSFPEGSNFWGKLTIGFVGSYSSFNASGYIEKEICVAFNGSSLFNNVGRYSALGLNVEKDFRISELIWNSDTNQWQILIYSHQPSGNNCPKDVILKCETSNSTTYSTTFEGITISNAEVSQIASYVNTRATVDGTSKTFYFADLPVYQDPYGDEIAVIDDIPTKISELNNDSGYITGYTETDPTVPAWAKASTKPSYTASEVGALPANTVIPSASTATPQMDGTGAAGSASTYSKGDHVHPSDTSREARVTTVNHGTNDTTFALTPNVLHTWGTVNSLTLTLGTGSSTYVDGYWFKFTAGSSFTALTLPTGVDWVTEPDIEAGKTYEVMIVDSLASYVTDGIGDTVKAKTRIVNHGTSDTTYQLAPNEFHIWGEVASLNLTLKPEANGYVSGYWFRFTSGSTPTVVTLPSGVQWYYDNGFVVEANKTYEVTIIDNHACYTDYTDDTHVATKLWVENNTQAPLESGVNIKTINNESILGSGNISVSGGSSGGGNVSSTTINTIVTLTEAQYTALATKDSSTLYIITE